MRQLRHVVVDVCSFHFCDFDVVVRDVRATFLTRCSHFVDHLCSRAMISPGNFPFYVHYVVIFVFFRRFDVILISGVFVVCVRSGIVSCVFTDFFQKTSVAIIQY